MAQDIILLPDEQISANYVSIIDNAKKEILLSTFKMQHSSKPKGKKVSAIYTALINAHNRGIKIKILTNISSGNDFLAMSNKIASKILSNNGIEVRGLQNGKITHAKICIVDDDIILIGSHNITMRAFNQNFECSLLLKNLDLAKEMKEIFIKYWNVSKSA